MPTRRSFLALTAAGALTACSRADPVPSEATSRPGGSKALLVYFSRAGENYHYGGRRNLEIGNTQVVAAMVSDLIACDVYRIEPADPYFAGKTVYPFTTHAMSGLGRAVAVYTAACRGATIAEGLAVQGETVRDARPQVESWLRRTNLLSA